MQRRLRLPLDHRCNALERDCIRGKGIHIHIQDSRTLLCSVAAVQTHAYRQRRRENEKERDTWLWANTADQNERGSWSRLEFRSQWVQGYVEWNRNRGNVHASFVMSCTRRRPDAARTNFLKQALGKSTHDATVPYRLQTCNGPRLLILWKSPFFSQPGRIGYLNWRFQVGLDGFTIWGVGLGSDWKMETNDQTLLISA